MLKEEVDVVDRVDKVDNGLKRFRYPFHALFKNNHYSA